MSTPNPTLPNGRSTIVDHQATVGRCKPGDEAHHLRHPMVAHEGAQLVSHRRADGREFAAPRHQEEVARDAGTRQRHDLDAGDV